MAKGVLLSRTTNYNVVDDVTYDFPWEAVQAFGGVTASDYWVIGNPTRIILPADGAASRYQVFFGAAATAGSTDAFYLGPQANIKFSSYAIERDIALWSRSGKTVQVPYATSDNIKLSFRSFGSQHRTFDANYFNLGVLIDPVPLAVACTARESNDAITEPAGLYSTKYVPTPATLYDPDGLHDGAGNFTAPAGAVAVSCSFNAWAPAASSSTNYGSVFTVNGVNRARYEHNASIRSPAFRNSGLAAISPGQTCYISHGGTSARSLRVGFSITFY